MQEGTRSYEANLDQEYEALSKRHGEAKKALEEAVTSYMKGGISNAATIQGPYGSGKTQLLYHLFKHAWTSGGVAIYLHLEKLLPKEQMGPSAYADYVQEQLLGELDDLRCGKSRLMSGQLAEYALSHYKRLPEANKDGHKVVLLIDEIEQQYRHLNEIVKTDDNSPLREVIARINTNRSGFYAVLAFAPISFYEFSKGEAQTSRLIPIIIPVLEPVTFRSKMGPIGNFMWWIGRGRYRGVTRALDIFKANVDGGESITKRAISELVRNIGSIGGVPALDMDSLDKVDGFDDFRDYLMYLGPHTATGALLGGDIRLTTRCLTLRSDQQDVIALLERSLRDCGVSKVTDISYYLYLVLDSLRNLEGAVPLAVEAEDWKSIVQIAEDIMVEFEGQENIPEEALDCLRDKASDFVYSMRKKAEATGPVPGGYCIAPQYLRTLFPFPITSPNLVSTKLDEQREALAGQTYIAKEESKNPEVFYFLNASKIEDFLSLNCKEYLSEDRSLVAVNLGEDAEPKLTKIAQWLKKERGLRIVNPPRFLSSFIINFCYWLKTERDDDLPVVGLSDKTKKIDSSVSKEISRKITYHGTKLDDYIRRETTARRPHKYDLKDSTGFETYDTGRVGYVTEVLGFAFEDGVKGIEVMYAFRQEFEKTSFVINESNRRRTGLATALEQLAVKETGKQLSKGAVLRRVKDSFENAVADIRDLAMEVTSEEFANIPEDGNSQRVFRGLYYYLKEWKNTSKAGEAIQKSKETLKKIITRLDDVERKCKKLRGQASNATEISYGVQKDIPCLRAIEKLLDDNRGTISPYTCFLPSTFTDKVVELIEPHLAEVEKKLSGFSDELEPYLKRYMAEVDAVTKFDAATYVMIEKDKDDLAKEFKDRFNTHCQSFSKGAAIDLLTLPETSPFCKEIDELVNEAKQLEEIDKLIRDVKKKAESINKLLKSWG